mmetsp:Transcript_11432/g.33964  ORF Transcript_11432/g.33964 Transcript_11432/m.33964 type:complete len:237 (+) Transcript_11432:217-927(+)
MTSRDPSARITSTQSFASAVNEPISSTGAYFKPDVKWSKQRTRCPDCTASSVVGRELPSTHTTASGGRQSCSHASAPAPAAGGSSFSAAGTGSSITVGALATDAARPLPGTSPCQEQPSSDQSLARSTRVCNVPEVGGLAAATSPADAAATAASAAPVSASSGTAWAAASASPAAPTSAICKPMNSSLPAAGSFAPSASSKPGKDTPVSDASAALPNSVHGHQAEACAAAPPVNEV